MMIPKPVVNIIHEILNCMYFLNNLVGKLVAVKMGIQLQTV
jgi:hypothetical protein